MLQVKQTGIVGPWRPAFLLSFFFFALSTIIIFHNERSKRFCQAPNLINNRTYTFVTCTIGATIGHFGLQVVRMISKFDHETVSHGSAHWMVLLITGIQALSQSLMFYYSDRNMVCEDYFGIRTSSFLWVEWLSTVPVMFYLTSIMDINKLMLTTDDKIVIFCAGAGLVCLFALNYTTNHYLAVFLMTTANVIMTYALFWLHGGSYLEHLKAIKNAADMSQNNDALTSLSISVKKRKLVCAGFMNYFFTLFPVAYFLKAINVLDHDTMFMTFCMLNFLSKGIFATLVTESHTELLDPKTFLLFSEKARSEQERRAFMRYMFKEVRVPLKSVTLGIALLKNSDEIRGADRETVGMIKDSCEYMAETLNDILAIERIEEGNLVLDMKPFHIFDLLNSVKDKSEGMCARQRLSFNYGMDSNVPTVVKGDYQRLEQVISTLVHTSMNSSSEGEGGEVSISVTFGTRVPDQVTFSVRGPNTNISVYQQRTMFKRVSQINPEELGNGKSSDISLAICTDIVVLHGGTIGCESLPGSGAEFFINLPLEVCDDEEEDEDEREMEAPLSAGIKEASVAAIKG